MKTQTLPAVSIIMPAYNSVKYIEESINSVLRQSYTDWELIVVNDGSTDNTEEIVQKFIEIDNRIKLFNKQNGGIASSRNFGHKQASGSFIAYLDHDDLWMPEKLALQMKEFGQRPEVDVILTNGIVFYSVADQKETEYNTLIGLYSYKSLYLKQIVANYIPILSVIVRRSVIESIGEWDEGKIYEGCDDYDYWFRMARARATFYSLKDQLFMYRKHSNNYSNDTRKMLAAEANVLLKNFDSTFLSNSKDLRFFKYRIHSLCMSLVKLDEISGAISIMERLESSRPVITTTFKTILKTNNPKQYMYLLKILLKLDRSLTF
jgi:teichuronic acid biosynthesis glycosyltransferase TuaG